MAEQFLAPGQYTPDDGLEEERTGRRTRNRLIILGLVVALAVVYMVYAAFPGNTRYFLTVSEFMGGEEFQDGRLLRVSGKLVPDSFQREGNGTLARFQIEDQEGSEEGSAIGSGPHLDATYVGVMPDLFFNPHSEIILEGKYGSTGVFETDSILVKCPSKYQSLEVEYPEDYNSYTPEAQPQAY